MNRHTLAAVVLVFGIAGCAVSTNDEPVELGSDLFERLLTTTTSSTSTPAGSAVVKAEEVYLLGAANGEVVLEAVPRDVDIDAGIQEVLGNLFTVRPDAEGEERPDEVGLTTAIPETAELISATLSPGTTTLVVDVRGLVGTIQGADLRDALAQIVWTATADSDVVNAVVFRNDGNPVPAAIDSGETTDQPVTRQDYSARR